ncbi:MAG: CinA family nicotinamide mononucleotide deamidase-related protein [Bacteroidales bacterium]
MNVGIITIGDEILMGQIVDTNSKYISNIFTNLGMEITEIRSIPDQEDHIQHCLDDMFALNDILILTGGLGPTKDDLTKKVLVNYFHDELLWNASVYKHVETLLGKRSIPMNSFNQGQAWLPSKAEILFNLRGTAPGMWFTNENKTLISLPGVPLEMEYLMQEEVVPRLKKLHPSLWLEYRLLIVYGIAESILAEILDPFEKALPIGMGLAYLPSPGYVKLRLTAKGSNAVKILENKNTQLQNILQGRKLFFINSSQSALSLEGRVGSLLLHTHNTLSTAESCTGGYLSHLITSVSGSSNYFKGGIVSYANEVKEELLGVDRNILKNQGAVSKETVLQMASHAKNIFHTDYALATSGIAGPNGGSIEKPVGFVWIALATPHGCEAQCFQFSSNKREINIEQSATSALIYLEKELLKQEKL